MSMGLKEELAALDEFEHGVIDRDKEIRLFQHLINTRKVWDMPSRFHDRARALVDLGVINHDAHQQLVFEFLK
jgi:hypothetical protein